MSEEEIQQAASECMRFVVGTFRNGKTCIGYFDGTHPFVECIKRGIENARQRKESRGRVTMIKESVIKLKGAEEVELWKKAAIAYVSSSNAQHVKGAALWADSIVKAFRERDASTAERQ